MGIVKDLCIYYLKFRTMKLNFIEMVMLFLIETLDIRILEFLCQFKLKIGENLHIVELDLPIEVTFIQPKSLMRTLWKWKYTGFNIDDLENYTGKAEIYFKHNSKRYILYINMITKIYYFKFLDDSTEDDNKYSSEFDIMFNQIELQPIL